MAAGKPHEPEVRFFSPMPAGYKFVPKGDVYITKNCRKKTHEAGKTLYVVVNKNKKPIGLRCPESIYKQVEADHQATAGSRALAVQKRDAAIEGAFEEAIVRLFPKIPKTTIPKVIETALKKRSRQVGRTGTLEIEDKVELAVRAHIRHCHTPYEKLLKEGDSRETARQKVWGELNEVATRWGGRPQKPSKPGCKKGKDTKARSRKTKAATTRASATVKKAVVSTDSQPPARAARTTREIIVISDSEDDELSEVDEDEADESNDSDWSNWSDFEY